MIELRERLAAEQKISATLQYRLHDLERRNHELAIRSRPIPDPLPNQHAPQPQPQLQPQPQYYAVDPQQYAPPAQQQPQQYGPAPQQWGAAPDQPYPANFASRSGRQPSEPYQDPDRSSPFATPPRRRSEPTQQRYAPPVPPPVEDHQSGAISELRSTLERVSIRLDALATTFQSQLQDLGYEIELASNSTRATAAVSDLAQERQLEALREAQVRLAGEQARYEIALRAELAGLADQLRQLH